MKRRFVIMDGEIERISIEGVLLPPFSKEFEVEDAPSGFFVELFLKNGERMGTLIDPEGKERSSSRNVMVLKISSDEYLIDILKKRQIEEVLSQEEVSFSGRTHQISEIRNAGNRLLVECKDSFVTLDFGEDHFSESFALSKYLFLTGEKKFFCVKFDKDYFIEEKGFLDEVHFVGKTLSIKYSPPSMEGFQIERTFSVSRSGELEKNRSVTKTRKGNYNEKTLGIAFFERLLYDETEEVRELLTNDFDEKDISLLKRFLGDYISLERASDAFVLTYENGAKKSFSIEVYGNLVGNVSEL